MRTSEERTKPAVHGGLGNEGGKLRRPMGRTLRPSLTATTEWISQQRIPRQKETLLNNGPLGLRNWAFLCIKAIYFVYLDLQNRGLEVKGHLDNAKFGTVLDMIYFVYKISLMKQQIQLPQRSIID